MISLKEFRQNAQKLYKTTPLTNKKHGLGIVRDNSFLDFTNTKKQEVSYNNKDHLHTFEELEQKQVKGLAKIKENMLFEAQEKIEHLHNSSFDLKVMYFEANKDHGKIVLKKEFEEIGFENLVIYIGENAKVNLLVDVSNNKKGFGTDFVKIILDNNSFANILYSKDMSKEYYLHSKIESIAFKDSNLVITSADFGGKLIVSDTITNMVGKGSNTKTNNLFYGRRQERFDIKGASIHKEANTYSLLTEKGVLEDSEAITRGLVKIESPAFDSNGYQKSDILMLDEKARAVSIPDLLIHNNEVACSHGSTISDLEEDKVFYLQSRGLSKKEAQRQLIEGFFYPVIDTLEVEEFKDFLLKKIEARLD